MSLFADEKEIHTEHGSMYNTERIHYNFMVSVEVQKKNTHTHLLIVLLFLRKYTHRTTYTEHRTVHNEKVKNLRVQTTIMIL